MEHIILILALLAGTVEKSALNLQVETNSVVFHTKSGEKITLCTAKLFYMEDGTMVPSSERYVLEIINDRYPKIIDTLHDSHSVSFEIMDIDEKKGDEVLAFHFAGANQYGVRIYKVDGIEIRPIKTQPFSSNMRSVKIKGKDIIVQNEERNVDGTRFVSINVFNVIGGECKLVREEKTPARK